MSTPIVTAPYPLTSAGSFSDLKELLKQNGCVTSDGNSCKIPRPVRHRILGICSDFLGGAWKNISVDEIKVVRMSGGMSNILFLCQLPNDQYQIVAAAASESKNSRARVPPQVLLRVYFNPETETNLVSESVIFTLLSEKHLGPKLYGVFNGGRLEEFIVSLSLSVNDIRSAKLSPHIARKLAEVHRLSVPITKEPSYVTEAMDRWIEKRVHMGVINLRLSSSNKTIQIDRDTLFMEASIIEKCLGYTKSPILFCHNDLQEGNILLVADPPKSNKDLVLIDFEYASYNYRGFDIANHWCEWLIDYEVDKIPCFAVDPEKFPTQQQKMLFCRAYLNEMAAPGLSHADNSASVDEETVAALVKEVNCFIPISHFFWGVWALLQVELSPIHFGYQAYAEYRLGLYFDLKADMLSMIDKCENGNSQKLINGIVSFS